MPARLARHGQRANTPVLDLANRQRDTQQPIAQRIVVSAIMSNPGLGQILFIPPTVSLLMVLLSACAWLASLSIEFGYRMPLLVPTRNLQFESSH